MSSLKLSSERRSALVRLHRELFAPSEPTTTEPSAPAPVHPSRIVRVGSCVSPLTSGGVDLSTKGDVLAFTSAGDVRVRWHGDGFPSEVPADSVAVVNRFSSARTREVKAFVAGLRKFGEV